MQIGCGSCPETCKLDETTRRRMNALSEAMVAMHLESGQRVGPNGADNLAIPAGYTYLAQFIAHDIAFHRLVRQGFQATGAAPTKLQPGTDHAGLLDLSSLYGGGPIANPSLYEAEGTNRPRWKLALDKVANSEGIEPKSPAIEHARDLPRRDPNPNAKKGICTAYAADPRNDVHILISQLAVLFAQFHNKVAEAVRQKSNRDFGVFEDARRLVLASFQMIVLKDFLPRLIAPNALKDVTTVLGLIENNNLCLDGLGSNGNSAEISKAFSSAAFRVGHVMVQRNYSLSIDRSAPTNVVSLGALIEQLQKGHQKKTQLRKDWVIEWDRFFFEVLDADNPHVTPDGRARNFSRKIWPTAPSGVFGSKTDFTTDDDEKGGILYRDLMRGFADGLGDADEWIKKTGMKIPKSAQMPRGRRQVYLKKFFVPDADYSLTKKEYLRLSQKTPLLLYIILEAMAHQDAQRLGYVGSRIVGGTICRSVLGASSGLKSAIDDWPDFIDAPMPQSMPELLNFLGQNYG